MSRKLKSGLGRSTPDQIFVRGHDLAADLIGKVPLGDFAFLELKGRLPSHHESDPQLVKEIEDAIRSRLLFRSRITLVPEADFGEAAYKTRLSVRR